MRPTAAAIVVISVLATTVAHAEKRRIVGVLDVQVEGVPKDIAAQFQTNLEKQLDSRSYWLAPKKRMHEMMSNSTKWTEGCVVGPCLHDVKTQTGADLVLLAALNGSGTSFGYVVTLVRTDTGRIVAQDSERCDVCTVSEALTSATLAAVRLVTAVPERLPDESNPNDAVLELTTAKLEREHAQTQARQRKVGIGMLFAGIIAAGAGVTMYLMNNRADYGLATAAGGGGLALGGAIILTF